MAACPVKGHKRQTDPIRRLHGECIDPRPTLPAVIRPPQTGKPRAHEQRLRMIWIDLQSFSGKAAVLVAAHLERHTHDVEVPPLIIGAQNGSVGGPIVDIRACRYIELLLVRRVDCQAFRPEQVALGKWEPILERLPTLLRAIPSVRATDVGAHIVEPSLRWMRHKTGNEPTRNKGNVPESVWRRLGRCGWGGPSKRLHTQHGDNKREDPFSHGVRVLHLTHSRRPRCSRSWRIGHHPFIFGPRGISAVNEYVM